MAKSVAAQQIKECCPCLDKGKKPFVAETSPSLPNACRIACSSNGGTVASTRPWTVKQENSCGVSAPSARKPNSWEDAHEDIIIDYLTWDGTPWQASIENGRFTHWPRGDRRFPNSDDKLNYITWDGTHWQARLDRTGFAHAKDGDFSNGRGHFSEEIHYLTWNGSHWKAKRFDGNKFLHAPGN